MTDQNTISCATCGATVAQNYCAACGERRFDRSRHTVRYFFAELTRQFTDLDNRLLRSVALVIFRPGFLTRQYVQGRKKQYIAPLALFAIANLAFFFAQPLANINSFNSTLEMQQRDYLHSSIVRAQVEQYLAKSDVDKTEFQTRFDATSEEIAKSLIILQVPLFALLLSLIRLRSGSLLFEHLIWSTHFYTFQILLNTLITVGVFFFLLVGGNDLNLGLPVLGVTLIYMFVGIRTTFGDRLWVAALRAAALLIAFGVVIETYRFLLFVVAFGFTATAH